MRVPVLSLESVVLPKGAPRSFVNVLTGEAVDVSDKTIQLAEAFRDFPVALLHGQATIQHRQPPRQRLDVP